VLLVLSVSIGGLLETARLHSLLGRLGDPGLQVCGKLRPVMHSISRVPVAGTFDPSHEAEAWRE